MSRRKLIWHIGPANAVRSLIPANLEAHDSVLEAAGLRVVGSREQSRLATHELLRTHRDAGLSRREVEGQWARICDRVWQHKGVSVLSTPDLCVADREQIRLALDPLIGVEVHLVVALDSFSRQVYGGWLAELRAGRATGWEKYLTRVLAPDREHRQALEFWAGHDLAGILGRWGWTFRDDRLHVVVGDDSSHWRHLLDLAGLPGAGLDPELPAYAGPAGAAVLRRVNRQLERPLVAGSAGLLTAPERTEPVMPTASTVGLRPLVEGWAKLIADAGHDLRGDLDGLVEEGDGVRMPGRGDQLDVAVDALAESLAENSRLRAVVADLELERERLNRKRRKLKRRLKRVVGQP